MAARKNNRGEPETRNVSNNNFYPVWSGVSREHSSLNMLREDSNLQLTKESDEWASGLKNASSELLKNKVQNSEIAQARTLVTKDINKLLCGFRNLNVNKPKSRIPRYFGGAFNTGRVTASNTFSSNSKAPTRLTGQLEKKDSTLSATPDFFNPYVRSMCNKAKAPAFSRLAAAYTSTRDTSVFMNSGANFYPNFGSSPNNNLKEAKGGALKKISRVLATKSSTSQTDFNSNEGKGDSLNGPNRVPAPKSSKYQADKTYGGRRYIINLKRNN